MDAVRAHDVAHDDAKVDLVRQDIGDSASRIDEREVVDLRGPGLAVPRL